MKKRVRKGSAILIVILMITVLATVALSVGYLTMAEVTMETNSQDGLMAYYAAESGIEDGLLRYRYDNNVELPIDTSTGKYDPTKVERIDMAEPLAANARNIGVSPTVLPNNPIRQYYDLSINYADPSGIVGKYSATLSVADAALSPELKKDGVLELAGDNSSANRTVSVDLHFRMKNISPSNLLEIKVFNYDGSDYSGYPVVYDSGQCTTVGPNGVPIVIPPKGYARIKAWGNDINYAMKAVVNGTATAFPIDSGVTKIGATGYYGSAKRKLQATIDRKTGKLIEIFDFTLYSNQSIS